MSHADVKAYGRLFSDRYAVAAALTEIMGVAGLIYLGALVRVPLPFTPVPVTLQTLVVLSAPALLGRNRAFAGILLYIVAGLAGSPLFAAPSAATLGYLAGFLTAPWIICAFRRTPAGLGAGMAAASLFILAAGSLWLQVFAGLSLSQALALGAAPFLAGDLIKAGVAWKLALRYTDVVRD